MSNARKTTPEKPETAPSMAPYVEVVFDFDENLEETRRQLHQDELDGRYPILERIGDRRSLWGGLGGTDRSPLPGGPQAAAVPEEGPIGVG